jgi:ABC-type proline/glycine betaine transport system substrate-binding protein
LLQADGRVRWGTATWHLATPTSDGSLRDVEDRVKRDECIVYHSWEPQAMLARGTQPPILGEVEVGVIIQLHLKRRHKKKYVTNPTTKSAKRQILESANKTVVNKKQKTEFFQKEFVPELNTKNLGNSASFLITIQMIPSTKRLRKN